MREIMSGKKYRHFKNKKYLVLYGEREYFARDQEMAALEVG
ncbi:Uncharacterised protein [uncultured Eubacterium sp.]|nr:Uncharacterised protein [uncultured Eubacterium sp.]